MRARKLSSTWRSCFTGGWSAARGRGGGPTEGRGRPTTEDCRRSLLAGALLGAELPPAARNAAAVVLARLWGLPEPPIADAERVMVPGSRTFETDEAVGATSRSGRRTGRVGDLGLGFTKPPVVMTAPGGGIFLDDVGLFCVLPVAEVGGASGGTLFFSGVLPGVFVVEDGFALGTGFETGFDVVGDFVLVLLAGSVGDLVLVLLAGSVGFDFLGLRVGVGFRAWACFWVAGFVSGFFDASVSFEAPFCPLTPFVFASALSGSLATAFGFSSDCVAFPRAAAVSFEEPHLWSGAEVVFGGAGSCCLGDSGIGCLVRSVLFVTRPISSANTLPFSGAAAGVSPPASLIGLLETLDSPLGSRWRPIRPSFSTAMKDVRTFESGRGESDPAAHSVSYLRGSMSSR